MLYWIQSKYFDLDWTPELNETGGYLFNSDEVYKFVDSNERQAPEFRDELKIIRLIDGVEMIQTDSELIVATKDGE